MVTVVRSVFVIIPASVCAAANVFRNCYKSKPWNIVKEQYTRRENAKIVYCCKTHRPKASFSCVLLVQKLYLDATGSLLRMFNIYVQSHDSSVGMALGYGVDDWGSWGSISGGDWEFFSSPPCPRVQNGSGAHPASYTRDTGGSFPGDKAAGEWSWPLTSI
jgi:hypothetical protein